MERTQAPLDFKEYLSQFSQQVQGILKEIPATIKAEAPDAEETISDRMPAFRFHGIVIYFATFKKHCSAQ